MATKPPTSCPILPNLVQSCPIEMTNVMLKNRPHLCNLKSIALVQVLAKKKSSCNLGVTLHSMSPMSPADSMFKFLDVQRPNPSCHTVQNCTSFFSILAPENFYREKNMRINENQRKMRIPVLGPSDDPDNIRTTGFKMTHLSHGERIVQKGV